MHNHHRPPAREITFNFSFALSLLKQGARVRRESWREMYLELQLPDGHSRMTLPYIFVKLPDNQFVPWTATPMDLLASDWVSLERTPAAA